MPISAHRRQQGKFVANLVRMWTEGVREPREVRTIEEYRDELFEARLATLDNTYYLFLCTATTGAGKDTADDKVITDPKMVGKKSLTLAPGHQNCQEIAARRRAAGIPSTPYPQHSEANCVRWDEAEAVLGLGLSAVAALCPKCEYREDCPYYQEYKAAEQCDHKIATLAHGRVSLPVLTKDCNYFSAHEDSLDLFAPVISLDELYRRDGQRPNIDQKRPLLVVARIADQAADNATDPNDRPFYRHMARIARCLDREFHAAFEPVDVTPLAGFRHEPKELNADLYRAACDLCLVHPPPREAMQLAVLAALWEAASPRRHGERGAWGGRRGAPIQRPRGRRQDNPATGNVQHRQRCHGRRGGDTRGNRARCPRHHAAREPPPSKARRADMPAVRHHAGAEGRPRR